VKTLDPYMDVAVVILPGLYLYLFTGHCGNDSSLKGMTLW